MKRSPSPSESDASPRSWCLLAGLAGLPLWLVGGLGLEGLHGLKAASYLQDDLRREMWTLAHAHGTLFALAAIVVSLLLPRVASPGAARFIDRAFSAGATLLPWGFLLGGAWHSESDPGLAILIVPAAGLLAAAALIVLGVKLLRTPA